MTVQTYTVNLEGNMANAAKSDQTAVQGLAASLFKLQESTGALAKNVEGLSSKLEGMAPHADTARESGESLFAALGEFELAKRGLEIVGEGIVEAGEFALEANEHVETMTRSFAALLGTSEAGGDAALDQIRGIADQLPEASAKVEEWAQGLMAVGQTDMGALNNSLHAIAGAEAMIAGGGEKVRGILERLNSASEKGTKVKFNVAQLEGTGVTEAEFLKQLGMTPAQLDRAKKTATLSGGQIADALTGALNAKSGDALESQMSSLTSVWTKGKDAIGRLFEDIDFGPIAVQLKSLFTMFDQAFPSGDALKKGIGGAIQGVVNTFATLIPIARHFFLETILLALQAYNFVRPLAAQFMGFLSLVTGLDEFTDGLKTLGIGLGVIIGLFVLLAAGAVAALALVVTGFGVVANAAKAVGEWIGNAVFAIVQFISKAGTFASQFISGFVAGLEGGIASVIGSIANLGSLAMGALKRVLGIASPSKLTAEVGEDGLAGGLVQGLDRGTSSVASAAQGLGRSAFIGVQAGVGNDNGSKFIGSPAPKSGANGRDGGDASTASGGGSGNIEQHNQFIVQVYGAVSKETAHEAIELFEEEWASLTERIAISRGVAAA